VRAVPDISFVYGLLHLYKNVHRDRGGAVHVSLETGFPLQGTTPASAVRLMPLLTGAPPPPRGYCADSFNGD
jgi:hypothetical protein